MAWRGVGEVWGCGVHEGELGGPFYRQPEAVAVNGDFRRWLRWRSARSGVIRESSAIVGVYWVRLEANRTWIRSLGQALVGTGQRGSVGGRERVRCCRATATVQRGALACMRPRGEPGSDGRRGTALCRGVPPVGRHGRSRCRRRRRRGRASALPTPGRLHARVCSFGQEEEAARNVPRALWPRD